MLYGKNEIQNVKLFHFLEKYIEGNYLRNHMRSFEVGSNLLK